MTGAGKQVANNAEREATMTLTLEKFLKAVNGKESDIIDFKTKKEALSAVRQEGCALRYVKEQTEAVCLAAVRKNWDAIKYVDKRVFKK